MVRLSYLLKPRWELFRRHDLRLRTNPDPQTARRMFKKRLQDAKRWQKVRLACFAGIYFSLIVTTIGAVVAVFGDVAWLENALGAMGGLMSSLTILFLAGVFIATRALNYIEVDLYFFSDESRQSRKWARAAKKAAAAEDDDEPGTPTASQVETAPRRRSKRVYTPPPLSSYRP